MQIPKNIAKAFQPVEFPPDATPEEKRKARAQRARENRKAREQVMRDCGLVKVRGALGGTYWE